MVNFCPIVTLVISSDYRGGNFRAILPLGLSARLPPGVNRLAGLAPVKLGLACAAYGG
jgi:hypothetical protein